MPTSPEPRVVGAVVSSMQTLTVTTMVECHLCYALLAGDRQEEHNQWHRVNRQRVHEAAKTPVSYRTEDF